MIVEWIGLDIHSNTMFTNVNTDKVRAQTYEKVQVNGLLCFGHARALLAVAAARRIAAPMQYRTVRYVLFGARWIRLYWHNDGTRSLAHYGSGDALNVLGSASYIRDVRMHLDSPDEGVMFSFFLKTHLKPF